MKNVAKCKNRPNNLTRVRMQQEKALQSLKTVTIFLRICVLRAAVSKYLNGG